ncbi:uncharacterized protein ARMOST_14552 [Armillaria ostoyae]|uniref:Uncharacterized protein n=1 Tax=Armillaria ostoyae TaxID=47428 RepID=A0A284RQU4_ARMOS|nr:uncharacterized protein ARMOST_14552 [Armillaria ostoyae]
MTLDRAKSGGSSCPQDTQNAPACRLRSPGFYRLPDENDIIDGTDWIDSLWEDLHSANPSSNRTSRCFDSTSRNICKLIRLTIKSHVQTNTLHAIYDILEYRGYLESVCPGIINDILQEIKDNSSEMVTFSADIRHRCMTAGPELEHKMSILQAVVIRQHRDFNPNDFVKTIVRRSVVVFFLLLVLLLPWAPAEPRFGTLYIGMFSAYLTALLTYNTYSYARDIVPKIDDLNTNTFQLIWAVRDMAGLLTLIAESEGPPFPDVLHAQRFLKAFRASFLGGREELSKLRSWLQGLPFWTDIDFGAHHWDDHDNNLLRSR